MIASSTAVITRGRVESFLLAEAPVGISLVRHQNRFHLDLPVSGSRSLADWANDTPTARKPESGAVAMHLAEGAVAALALAAGDRLSYVA